jgi:hypothetical protein
MPTEGWICPKCQSGVAPSCERCPCAKAVKYVIPRLGKTSIGPIDPTGLNWLNECWLKNAETGLTPQNK